MSYLTECLSLFSCTRHFWLNCSSDYKGKTRQIILAIQKNLFLERNSSEEASLALNTLTALGVTREKLEKSTGIMILTLTNSCTGDHFY